MKWWTVSFAVVALILASVSIWLGLALSGLVIDAQALWLASLIFALVAATWVAYRGPRNRAIGLYSLLALASIQGFIGAFNILPKGPFCSRYLAEGGACAQIAPLAIDVYLFAPVFILAIAALLSTFWPQKQNPVMAARQTASPPR
jgi:hypothetical protein